MLPRDGVRKPKVWLQMELVRDRNNKKGFYRCVIQKRKDKKDEFPIISITGKPIRVEEKV